MRWQSSCAWILGSLLATQGWAAQSGNVPIIAKESAPPMRAVQPASTLAPIVAGDDETSSRSRGPNGSLGVIRLIEPPRVATLSERESSGNASRRDQAGSQAAGEGRPKPLPAADAPAGKPIKALRSPLVVHRTARLAIDIESQAIRAKQHRVEVTIRNETPQAAGRTQLIVTVPDELDVVKSRPTSDDRQQLSDSQRFVYNLDGLAGSDQTTITLTVDGAANVRGLIHAIIETQAEASKLVASGSAGDRAGDRADDESVVRATPQPKVTPPPPPKEKRSLRRGEKLDLPLLINGPKRAQINATVVYSLSLENLSDIDLDDIAIKAKLPDGVYLEGRTDLKLASSLSSGLQRSMDVAVRAQQAGEFRLTFEAWHGGLKIAEQTTELEVVASDLKAGIGGPQSWSVGKEATFVIDLECKGTEPLKDVVVTLQLPANIRVTTVEHEAGYDAERRLMAWRIVELEPGASVKLHYKALGLKPGDAVQGLLVKTPDLVAPLKTSLTSQVRGTVGIKFNQNFLRR